MSPSTLPPRREQLSTYVRQDRLTDEEIRQSQVQDQRMTFSMGGVLPEQPDPTCFQSILDVGCGAGNWLIELAQTYPMIPQLVGIDASTRIVEFARAQADACHVSDRVQFRVMNVLSFLDFPQDSFDLINMRFGANFLRTWEWSRILQEWKRVAKANAVIRIVEPEALESTNVIVCQRSEWFLNAFYQSGHLFKPQSDGLTSELIPLLQKSEISEIQTHVCTLDYQRSIEERQLLTTYMDHGFRMLLPFLQKWMRISGDQDQLSQQLWREMQQPDFALTLRILTMWGICNPSRNLAEIS